MGTISNHPECPRSLIESEYTLSALLTPYQKHKLDRLKAKFLHYQGLSVSLSGLVE